MAGGERVKRFRVKRFFRRVEEWVLGEAGGGPRMARIDTDAGIGGGGGWSDVEGTLGFAAEGGGIYDLRLMIYDLAEAAIFEVVRVETLPCCSDVEGTFGFAAEGAEKGRMIWGKMIFWRVEIGVLVVDLAGVRWKKWGDDFAGLKLGRGRDGFG
ncbi:hypothetical protein [Prosthecobacter sp.]|uniref:hypothetical protein n=1 Tax=Prosthecobacter sp. TaxID=1965333 RepID=UPI00378430F0